MTKRVSVDALLSNIDQINSVINQHGSTPLPADLGVQILAVRANLALASALLVLADAMSSDDGG